MNSVDRLSSCFCPFGYLDLKTACSIGDEIWMIETDIFEIIDDFRESIWLGGFNDIDPVYCVLDYVLQMARNLIDEELNYDFINDYSWAGTEIYTYWNYMCSSYDWSCWAVDELTNVLQSATPESQVQILSDRYCLYFLRELGIDISWEN